MPCVRLHSDELAHALGQLGLQYRLSDIEGMVKLHGNGSGVDADGFSAVINQILSDEASAPAQINSLPLPLRALPGDRGARPWRLGLWRRSCCCVWLARHVACRADGRPRVTGLSWLPPPRPTPPPRAQVYIKMRAGGTKHTVVQEGVMLNIPDVQTDPRCNPNVYK